MKYTAIILVLLSSVYGCDSGGSSPSRSPSTIAGFAALGAVTSGTVTAYDFSHCEATNMLGKTELDGEGQFGMDVTPTNDVTPVLFELSGYTYVEEASGVEVKAKAHDNLYAAVVLKPKESRPVTLSFWTTVAYLAAKRECSENIANQINENNADFSRILGMDITKVRPLSITTDHTDEAVSSSDEKILYGIFNAAVSAFTVSIDDRFGILDKPGELYNSATFIGVMLQDVENDGLLDGKDIEDNLYLVSIPMDTNSYRLLMANHIFRVLYSERNLTGLTETDVLDQAERLNNSEALIYGFEPLTAFSVPEKSSSPLLATAAGPEITEISVPNSLPLIRFGFGTSFFVNDPVGVSKITFTAGLHELEVSPDASGEYSFHLEVVDVGMGQNCSFTVYAENKYGAHSSQTVQRNMYGPDAGAGYASIDDEQAYWNRIVSGNRYCGGTPYSVYSQ